MKKKRKWPWIIAGIFVLAFVGYLTGGTKTKNTSPKKYKPSEKDIRAAIAMDQTLPWVSAIKNRYGVVITTDCKKKGKTLVIDLTFIADKKDRVFYGEKDAFTLKDSRGQKYQASMLSSTGNIKPLSNVLAHFAVPKRVRCKTSHFRYGVQKETTRWIGLWAAQLSYKKQRKYLKKLGEHLWPSG